MKIVICGSMKFYDDMENARSELEKQGHSVIIPERDKAQTGNDHSSKGWLDYKRRTIISHNKEICDSDAVLVMNLDNKGVKNYIGSNTLMEIAVAFAHGKRIFLTNPVPDQPSSEELNAIDPVVLNRNLNDVK